MTNLVLSGNMENEKELKNDYDYIGGGHGDSSVKIQEINSAQLLQKKGPSVPKLNIKSIT